jgi:hypothetical protein
MARLGLAFGEALMQPLPVMLAVELGDHVHRLGDVLRQIVRYLAGFW